jgi:dolichol-phosphate mannosyltransferase
MTTPPAIAREEPVLCIVLPVLNEASNIERLLEPIDVALSDMQYVVCVIDDGSRDGTVDRTRRAAAGLRGRIHVIERVKRHAGSQRGSALRVGMLWGLSDTGANVFVEMDGDLSHRPEELQEGVKLVADGECDVAIASKYVPGSMVVNRPLGRRWISRACNLMVRGLMDRRILDYSNGYRFYSRPAAEAVAQTRIRYGSPIYLSEVLGIWIARGLRIREFQTTYVGRGEGESKLRIVDLVKAAIAVFEIAVRVHVVGFAVIHRAPGDASADISKTPRSKPQVT